MRSSIVNFFVRNFLVLLVLQGWNNNLYCLAGDNTCASDSTGGPFTLDHTIELERTRYCTKNDPIYCNGETNDKYRFFENRMTTKAQKKMYITENNEPEKQVTKNLVMFFNGQQTKKGYNEGLIGTRTGYKDNFGIKTQSSSYDLSDDSYADQIFNNDTYFSRNDTFVGMVLDPRFHYEYTGDQKTQIVSAYLYYIMDKLNSHSAETVLLVGHSRGGCLAMRLGKEIATLANYPGSIFYQTRIIIQTWDPVCADNRLGMAREFGVVTNDPIDNPSVADASYKVHTTDMNAQFQNTKKSCLAIKSFLSGDVASDYFTSILYKTHAFGHRDNDGIADSYLYHNGFEWYQQTWNELGHTGITWSNWDEAEEHLKYAMNMDCPCGTSKPARMETQWCPDKTCYFNRVLPNGKGGRQGFRCVTGFSVVGGGKPSSADSSANYIKRNNGFLYTDSVELLVPKDAWSGVACAKVTHAKLDDAQIVKMSKSKKGLCVNAKIEKTATCPSGWWMDQGQIESSNSHFKVNSQKFLTTEDSDGRIIVNGIWGEIKNKGASCRTATITATARCLKISDWWTSPSYTWGEDPIYTKKYSEKWPICPNVKCVLGTTLKELELECNSYSSCTGFTFPVTSESKQNGCLKMCGSNDASDEFSFGTHDYWSK